jgi:hypothetical protein
MTVTTQKIKAEVSQQTADHAKGVVDVSEKMVGKVFNKLKAQNLTEKHAMMLASTFFKVPDKNGKDSVLKMFNGGGNCATINAEYLQEHYSTDSRVAGKNIAQALVVVVGYAHFPSYGLYVRKNGAIYYNTWRSPRQMFTGDDYGAFYRAGLRDYYADIDLHCESDGEKGGDVDLRDALKPVVWLALEKLWFPNKPEEADIFTDWLSLAVTYSDHRARWVPVLRSDQGMGKGTLVNTVLRPLLGAGEVKEMDYDRVVNQFSGEHFMSRLVVINEVETKTSEQYRKLKDKVSDDYLFVERKGEQSFDAQMFFATLMFTNKEKPLIIPANDRRYWIPDFIHYPEHFGKDTAERQKETSRVLGLWRQAVTEEGGLKEIAMFLRWLALNRAQVHNEAPSSEGKTDIVSHRTEDASDKLVIYLDSHVHNGEAVKPSDLQKYIGAPLSDADVKRVLKDQGWQSDRHSISGTQMRCWTKGGEKARQLHEPRRSSF